MLQFRLHYLLWPLHWSVPKFKSLNIWEWISQFENGKNIYHLYHLSLCLSLCVLVTSSLSQFFFNKWVMFFFMTFLTLHHGYSLPIKRIQLKINISIIMKVIKIHDKIFKKKNEKKLNLLLILSSMRRMLWTHMVLTLNLYGEFKQKETDSF